MFTAAAAMCLATAIYFEARGEPVHGQYAVAEVIVNRQQDDRFPNTICGVIHEQRVKGRCQFSFACKPYHIREPEAFAQASEIAVDVLTAAPGTFEHSGGALFFHTQAVNPKWARSMEVTTKIGAHIFLAD